jgi:hypothetical protein
VTARLGDNTELYGMVNFQQNTVDYTASPVVRGHANAGILFRRVSSNSSGSRRSRT